MSPQSKPYSVTDPNIGSYVQNLLNPEDDILKNIRKRAALAGLPNIHISPFDVSHISALCKLGQVRNVVEIGTLCGYSAVVIARTLPAGGHLWSIEKHAKNAALAQISLEQAGVENTVTIRQGNASDILPSIESHGPFDLLFLDADKENYLNYLDWALKNVRVGGMILADNAFAWGLVTQDEFVSAQAQSEGMNTKKFNETIASHSCLQTTILPTSEGLSVSVRIA